jgi:hypothetical protein
VHTHDVHRWVSGQLGAIEQDGAGSVLTPERVARLA